MKQPLLMGIGALMLLTACATDGRSPNVGVGVSIGGSPPPPVVAATPRGGPPPWAPAHGRRAKEAAYRYYYYPASGVYFNVSTRSYFYLNGGTWQVAMALPSTVIIDQNNYVSLELETDKPYLFYEEHKVKYRGHGNSKGRGQGHGRWKDKD